MVNIAGVLNNLLPQTVIAGNWASILSITTPHKTFLLSNEMKVNWEKDFLKKNKVRYLLLTQGRFGNELGAYVRFFREEFKKTRVIAIFRLYNTSVYLIELNNPEEKLTSKLELEKFRREIGEVIFDPQASGRLILNFSEGDFKRAAKRALDINQIYFQAGWNEFKIRLRGRGVLNLIVKNNTQVVLNTTKSFNSQRFEYKSLGVISNPAK